MRHYRALAKHCMFATAAVLALALPGVRSGAQLVFDGYDSTTDRGNILFDLLTNRNAYPTRQGYNNVGPSGTPNQPIDAHRAQLRFTFPYTLDLEGVTAFNVPGTVPATSSSNPALGGSGGALTTTLIVDNPFGLGNGPYGNFDKSNVATATGLPPPAIFDNSSQPLTFPFSTNTYAFAPASVPYFNPALNARSLWLPTTNAFTIPAVALRTTAVPGFSFAFTASDPTITNDPYAANPPIEAQNDYGYVFATHNDFTVTRGSTSSPLTADEASQFPNVDANVYSAVHNVLATEYTNTVNNVAGAHAIAQWTIGAQQNHNADVHDPYDTTLPSANGYNAANTVPLPVPYDGEYNTLPAPNQNATKPPYLPNSLTIPTASARPLDLITKPNATTPPGNRSVKFVVAIYSPGSGTSILDTNGNPVPRPNVQRAFVRVSWKNTILNGAVNPGTPNPSGVGYVAGAGGVNDPVNSRIFNVDLSQPGWINLGPPDASPSSFPNGGGGDQIVVTLFTLTPDNINDPNLYGYQPLVTADACRFTQQDTPGLLDKTILLNPDLTVQFPNTLFGPLHNPGPANNTNNPFARDTEYVSPLGRILGPPAGVRTVAVGTGSDKLPHQQLDATLGVDYLGSLNADGSKNADGSILWYCVREEIINNQVRVATDPTLPVNVVTNPLTIDPAATATAPVFYCLTNENSVTTVGATANQDVQEPTKLRVRWRYVGYPDNGSATSFTAPVIANVRGRDLKYHTIVFFCGSSNTSLNGNAGRIYALDALGDPRSIYDNAVTPTAPLRTTQTTAYWTYPSLRPLDAAHTTPGTPNEYFDPNFTGSQTLPGVYPVSGVANPPNTPRTPSTGFWWAPDQTLFSTGTQEYFDGDLVPGTTQDNLGNTINGTIVKTDSRITMGGITGSPIVMDDPSNPAGPMILVVPSLDGHLYAFDAAGRGDFDDTVPLPVPPVDPANPNLPAATIGALNVNYAVPGTTQRLWTWPHFGADAFHIKTALASITQANTYPDEATNGAMPYSPAFDPSYTPGNVTALSPLLISAGTGPQNGLPGSGHVYGVLPLHDNGFVVGPNNVLYWNVAVNSGLAVGTTDRRYFAFPHEGARVSDPSDTPLLDIPGLPTIFHPTNSAAGVRYAYFGSGGRVYSVQLPTILPPGGVLPVQRLNWVYPYTPYIPYSDPNDNTTLELTQGVAPRGVAVIPGNFAGINSSAGAVADACYALLTDGTILALEADPDGDGTRQAGAVNATQTNLLSRGQSQTGSFTEGAPTLIALAVDPNLGGAVPIATQAPPTSVPALMFGDDSGGVYAIQTYPRTYSDGSSSLPYIFNVTNNVGGQFVTPPVLVGSTLTYVANTILPGATDPRFQALQLNTQPNQGGFVALGDTNGQLNVFGVGRLLDGYGATDNGNSFTGAGAGDVTIDVREFDAYTDYATAKNGHNAREWDGVEPTRGQALGSGYTPAHKEATTRTGGAAYGNTIQPAAGNVNTGVSTTGLAVDEGGNVYLVASGVYHAQTPDPTAQVHGTTPTISVTFNVSQNGTGSETHTVQAVAATPLNQTNSPGKTLLGNIPWPDDRAIALADKENLSIYGIDENAPSGTPDPTGQGDNAPTKLVGTANNVFPWVAKYKLPIIPRAVGSSTTYTPLSSGYTASVSATITQQIIRRGQRANTASASKTAGSRLGQRDDTGQSNSPYQPDPNDPTIGGASRGFFVTNPLALTVRGFPNSNFMQDLTGTPRELNGTHNNIIGWTGPVDNPDFNNAVTPVDIRELLGTGASVGVADVGGNAQGYTKPIFAPFDMTSDNATATYTADTNGTRSAAIYVMDRSDLPRVTGGVATKVRVSVSPLTWQGTVRSVLNPLPFDQLPDNNKPTVDYPAIDPRSTSLKVGGADATQGAVNLAIPTPAQVIPGSGGEVDPSTRVPQPTRVDMSINVPRYQPANVNRGLTKFSFRGTNVYTGGMFTDQAGFARGYNSTYAPALGLTPQGSPYQEPIMGPLDTNNGAPIVANTGSFVGSSPAGGYIANVSITLVPTGAPGGVTQPTLVTRRGQQGAQTPGGASNQKPISRLYQTGISISPSFRMRVLESTLDMGSVPAGTGYSDVVNGGYRYPFAPSATRPYEIAPSNANPTGQINYSPWDVDGQFLAGTATGLPTLGSGTTIPKFGQFFRPFTLVNESNVNLTNVRMSKFVGPHSNDTSANPNLGDVINNNSLSLNPSALFARSLRLNSDVVNSLLSPPLLAASYGQGSPGLGTIGVISSFDHNSYANSVVSELPLFPLMNPAVTNDAPMVNGQPGAPIAGSPVQQAIDLYNLGLIEIGGTNQWTTGIQPYPTIHKPRRNDGTGTIATIPDQPHDFQTSALNNNPTQNGQPSYYQQLTNAGLFGRPSVAIAVPMGTPVGTYNSPLYPFEDGLPIQWQEWLAQSDPNKLSNPTNPVQTAYLGINDGILNTNTSGLPTEPYATPGTSLKVTVRESRLTEGATTGVLPQIDLPGITNNVGNYDPLGFNMQPAALMIPYSQTSVINYNNRLMLFWTTNRQQAAPGSGQNNGKYVDASTGLPTPVSPLNIAYTSLTLPYVKQDNIVIRPDAVFSNPANVAGKDANGNVLPGWWGINGTASYGLLPGFDMNGLPNNYANLFGTAGNPATVAYASPATTLGVDFDENTGAFNNQSTEAYLAMQGAEDVASTATVGFAPQRTLSRTFLTALNGNGQLGLPQTVTSFDNDPNVPKLSPRPALIRLHNVTTTAGTQDMKFLYVFYHSGSQGRTSLYYNVNTVAGDINGTFSATGFQALGDQKLPTPAALTWQSDPYPVYRHVLNPLTNKLVDAVEVMYTGVLRNRQTVEVLLSRYRIVEEAEKATADTPALQVGQLVPIPFPTVHQETLTRLTGTNTYAARDAGWFVPGSGQISDATVQAGNTANGLDPTANRFMRLYIQPNYTGALYLINGLNNNNAATRGRIDAASGLVYFSAVATDNTGAVAKDAGSRPLYSGGQAVVDPRSGTISFPNIAPGKRDAVIASYTPYVMRLNTARDESNAERDPAAIGITDTNTMSYAQLAMSHPGTVSSGQNYAPTYVMDRAPNSRGLLKSPQVLFNPNGTPAIVFDTQGRTNSAFPPTDRMWTLYRKTDAASKSSGLYYKSLRLTARLPYPVALSSLNGGSNASPTASQVISSLSVKRLDPATGNAVPLYRGYEVDWVRGRVYFQEEDEGDIVQISYTYFNPVRLKNPGVVGNSGVLTYRVAWSDEIDASASAYDQNSPNDWIGYVTTPEVAMPVTTPVNEGQVTAFKDPLIDKLWVFWSSTRASTIVQSGGANLPLGQTDLFFQTIAPQFYPAASNQY